MKSLLRDTRGAVFVEFLIAFLPMFVFFQGLVQYGMLVTGKLVVQHSAVTATRAAVVVIHDDPRKYPGVNPGVAQGSRKEAIDRAAAIPLRSIRAFKDFSVTLPSAPQAGDSKIQFGPRDPVTAHVTAKFHCKVPIGRTLVCGVDGTRDLTAEATLPNQGASYTY